MIRFKSCSRTDQEIFNNEVGRDLALARRDKRKRRGGIDRAHLKGLVREAADWVMFIHPKISLPWNVENWPPASWGAPANEVIPAYRRYAGWLRAVAFAEQGELREVLLLLERTQSEVGHCSPRTSVELNKIVAKWHSPYELERWLRHTKWRANQVLAPYGVKVVMADVYAVAEGRGNKRVGKGAFAAAGLTLQRYLNRGDRLSVFHRARGLAAALKEDRKVFRAAQFLVTWGHAEDFRAALRQLAEDFSFDTTDGVESFVAKESQRFRGVFLEAMIVLTPNQVYQSWFCRSADGESFHSTLGRPRDAARQAIAAWRLQRVAKQSTDAFEAKSLEEAMKLLGLDPNRLSVLVRVKDSYEAGNCRPGTEAWMRGNGFLGRLFVGTAELGEHWSDSRVRPVILAALQREAAGLLEVA